MPIETRECSDERQIRRDNAFLQRRSIQVDRITDARRRVRERLPGLDLEIVARSVMFYRAAAE
jgi:hypothetical protein